jgi:hypothetical protein
LKNVAFMSAGAIDCPAKAVLASMSITATRKELARNEVLPL